MLVYDMTSMRSFESITSWLDNIHKNAPEETKIMLLGNKCDIQGQRQVPLKQAKEVLSWLILFIYYKFQSFHSNT
jgi:GTPase SAR1 family protein